MERNDGISVGTDISTLCFLVCSGVYLKPTEEENRRFDERVTWLESVMVPRRELYETEEKTLRVMLAEEEEEKEKERRETERKNQGSYTCTFLNDARYRTFFTQRSVSLTNNINKITIIF